MAAHNTENDPSLLISSAPLGWPDIIVEVRLFRRNVVIDRRDGYDRHCIMIWDQPVDCEMRIGGQLFTLGGLRTPAVVVPADTPFHAAPKTPARFCKLLIETAFVSRVAREALTLKHFALQPATVDSDQDLRAVGYLLSEAVTGHQPLDAEMLALIARETAIHLVSNYSDMRRPRQDLAGRIPSAKLVRILDYLAANLDKTLTVASLAREAGLSEAHFSRAFAKSTGRAPHAYVVARRVAKAEYLLRNSPKTLDQIAAQCGFYDQAHFNRVFRRSTGKTPRQYRLERDS